MLCVECRAVEPHPHPQPLPPHSPPRWANWLRGQVPLGGVGEVEGAVGPDHPAVLGAAMAAAKRPDAAGLPGYIGA